MRRRLSIAVQSVLALALIAVVGWQFAKILGDPALRNWPVVLRFAYLVPAAVLYLAAHVLWATYFTQLLWQQGEAIPWRTGVRAYFVSLFGKYVPGKVLVILLRMRILQPYGASWAVVGVCATYETLTTMAAGSVIGVCLLPWVGLGEEFEAVVGPTGWSLLVAMGCVPVVLVVLHKLTARLARRARGPDARPLPSPSVALLARGLLQAVVGWCLLGVSLWLTLRGVAPEPVPFSRDFGLQCVAEAALSYVAGFFVLFSPGGLGARELILQKLLTRQLTILGDPTAPALAAVATLVLRLIWSGAEVGTAVVVWWFGRSRAASATTPEPVSIGGGAND